MDWIKDKLGSRKLWAFAVATALLLLHAIPVEVWQTIALAYLGSQGLVDAAQGLVLAAGKRDAKAVAAGAVGLLEAKLKAP
jgi:hypothetical protein